MIKFKYLLVLFISGLLGFIAIADHNIRSQNKIVLSGPSNSVFNLNDSDFEWVEMTLASMTLREKCAQMVIPYARSENSDEDSKEFERLRELIEEQKVGGFMFLKGNIQSQAEITNKLQKLSAVPLLIAADYERGLGMRLTDAVEFPYNMAIAAAGDTHLTFMMGKITALEGRALGVHQNYAPLLDINRDHRNPIINIRAYSDDPVIVARHGNAFINGMRSGRMITTAKHFPGHGATDLDSHTELPVISISRQELTDIDLYPFKEAIKSNVQSIMIGHLEVPAYDETEKLPATLSEKVINRLLKEELKFKGLVVTDALNMNAIRDNFDAAESAKMAVLAGNDLILFPSDEIATIDAIFEGVKEKEIPEEMIDGAVRKILSAKKWLELDRNKLIDLNGIEKGINKKLHRRIADDIAEKSVTLLKDDKNLIPLNPSNYRSILCVSLRDVSSRKKAEEPIPFADALSEEIGKLERYDLTLRSKKRHYTKALNLARKADLIILPVFVNVRSSQGYINLNERQKDFINDVIELNKPVILVSFGSPYIIMEVENPDVYLCAYGEASVSQTAMVRSIIGRRNIQGTLPVTIPSTGYTLGTGIIKKPNHLIGLFDLADTLYDFSAVDSIMESGIKDTVYPGGVLLVGSDGKILYNKAFGRFTYDDSSRIMTTNAIFDLASVSKVIGTTSAAMILYDEGKFNLDDKVSVYLPEFGVNGKENVTIRNLLLHNAGLTAWKPYYKEFETGDQIINDIMSLKPEYEPGTKYVYSDLGMITMQKVIEKITGMTLDQFLMKRLFYPLKMDNTMYNPPEGIWDRVVPTESDNYYRMTTVRGKVHDETAYMLGGVAGHAGLFSTASDLAILLQTYLNGGIYDGKQIFNKETIDNWTTKQTEQSSRGLGWDTKSPDYSSAGDKFSMNSFGHTGFTGTSVWVDKDKKLFVILLTNRVHPTRANRKIIQFRPKLHNAIVDAVTE